MRIFCVMNPGSQWTSWSPGRWLCYDRSVHQRCTKHSHCTYCTPPGSNCRVHCQPWKDSGSGTPSWSTSTWTYGTGHSLRPSNPWCFACGGSRCGHPYPEWWTYSRTPIIVWCWSTSNLGPGFGCYYCRWSTSTIWRSRNGYTHAYSTYHKRCSYLEEFISRTLEANSDPTATQRRSTRAHNLGIGTSGGCFGWSSSPIPSSTRTWRWKLCTKKHGSGTCTPPTSWSSWTYHWTTARCFLSTSPKFSSYSSPHATTDGTTVSIPVAIN